jgi:hypothetical protein
MPHYEIHVRGRLDLTWSAWFHGRDVRPIGQGETVLAGHLVDQAALHAVVEQIRDLNLELLSLRRLDG